MRGWRERRQVCTAEACVGVSELCVACKRWLR
jgi:hypothetical protein